MTEVQPTYHTNKTQRDNNRWRCTNPECGIILGTIIPLGNNLALLRHGQVTIGEAWVRCGKCGKVRRFVPVKRNLPEFIDRALVQREAERQLIRAAEREIREAVEAAKVAKD